LDNVKYNPIVNAFERTLVNYQSLLPHVIWHITDICYLSCPFCFSTKTGKTFSIEQLNDYVKLFCELGVQKIDIAGGEPLWHPNLPEICESLVNNGIYITITTSGDGSQNNKKWLINNTTLFTRVIVSMDGSTPNEHDKIRGKEGLFSELVDFIQSVKNKDYKFLRINTVVTNKLLLDDKLKAIIEIIKKIEPIEWCLIEPHPANMKPTFPSCSITLDQFSSTVYSLSKYFLNNYMGTTHIIVRRSQNYSSYWVLYPWGMLSQHSGDTTDLYKIEFSLNSIQEIKLLINKGKIWIPMSGNN